MPCIIDGRPYDQEKNLDLPGCIAALGHRGTIYRNPNVSDGPLTVKNDDPGDNGKSAG